MVPDKPYEDAIRAVFNEKKQKEELQNKIGAIIRWLEDNQPDVFGRGLWDAISEVEDK